MERWECGHNWGFWHPDHLRLSQRSQRLWSPSARWLYFLCTFYLTMCSIKKSLLPTDRSFNWCGNESGALSDFILSGNIGHEGRIGMAAVTGKEGAQFDGSKLYKHVVSYLPSYARPRFIRVQVILFHTHLTTFGRNIRYIKFKYLKNKQRTIIFWYFTRLSILYFSLTQNAMEVTGTFKQMKVKLVEENFDPGRIQDPLYILDDNEKSYVPLTAQVYCSILSGNTKLWAGP